ncbi:MAG TPA: hypothetical protein VKY22_26130 [Bradyrhizobium sp.]|nr:hypothetical protein [Bradyrhizobium sp.]
MDAKLRKYQARNEGPRYSHNEIADDAQARALHYLTRQPPGRDADSQYDEKTFTRYVHFRVLTIRPPTDRQVAVMFIVDLGESGYCAKLIGCRSFERRAPSRPMWTTPAASLSNFASGDGRSPIEFIDRPPPDRWDEPGRQLAGVRAMQVRPGDITLTIRTTRSTVSFSSPFILQSLEGVQPAGE